jgi:sugar phosphate isomerase/epimerase
MTRPLDADALGAAALELNRLGMSVDTVVTYTDFTHPDAAFRESEFDKFKTDIETAVLFKAAYLRLTSGKAHPETSRSKGIELTLAYFKRAAEFADKNGVGLLFENHSKPGVWQYYDFAGAPEIYFDIAGRLAGTAVDLLFDTANACFYKQDPVRMLERIFARVRRIHVADIIASDNQKPVLIGQGIVPLSIIFKFLKQTDFSGGLSIEEASFNGIAGVKKAFETARDLWINA